VPAGVITAPVSVPASGNIRIALTAAAGSTSATWNVLSSSVEVSA
jgi:hypothetical protein